MRNLSFKPFVLSVSIYRGDNVRICELNKACFWGPALEFSTLLEVTEAGTIHINASCVVLLFYVHGKHQRSCRDGQLT